MSNHISKIPRPFLSTAAAAIALAVALSIITPKTSAQAGEHLLGGSFSGQSNHITTGKITVEKKEGRTIIVLHNDFSLDSAPNPTRGSAKLS